MIARRFRLLACLALLPAGPVSAQTAAPPPAPAEAAADPALWVVRDADTTIYLFGTIHFMRPGTAWQSPKVAAALKASETLVLEIADPDNQAAVAPLVQRYGLSPDRPLSSLLTPAEQARLGQAAAAMGRSAAQLDPMRPWLAGVMLSSAVILRGGFDPASGIDLALRRDAIAAGKPVLGLESLADEMRMLSNFPEEGQLGFLRKTLADFDVAPVELEKLVRAWRTGDAEAIDAISLAPLRATPRVYQAVIVERNRRWAEELRTMLAGKGHYFVAVGTMHLVGPDSVLRLLGPGVTVERVR
ncbi:TraB/GumN family protein [Sphingomonas sp. KR3-1]|uniref:TraB/GumN family protein n=1 Tax=Sphingomonas sp. KR3-1 TaxID=3156611 RepID=UPI0032B42B35